MGNMYSGDNSFVDVGKLMDERRRSMVSAFAPGDEGGYGRRNSMPSSLYKGLAEPGEAGQDEEEEGGDGMEDISSGAMFFAESRPLLVAWDYTPSHLLWVGTEVGVEGFNTTP